jgi:hypothetical protein
MRFSKTKVFNPRQKDEAKHQVGPLARKSEKQYLVILLCDLLSNSLGYWIYPTRFTKSPR